MFRVYPLNHDGSYPLNALSEAQHMTTARRAAVAASAEAASDVLIVRAPDRPVLVVHPDGTFDPPAGMKGACTRNAGTGPCFCAACRADRAGRR